MEELLCEQWFQGLGAAWDGEVPLHPKGIRSKAPVTLRIPGFRDAGVAQDTSHIPGLLRACPLRPLALQRCFGVNTPLKKTHFFFLCVQLQLHSGSSSHPSFNHPVFLGIPKNSCL